jgi:hypothetical protein
MEGFLMLLTAVDFCKIAEQPQVTICPRALENPLRFLQLGTGNSYTVHVGNVSEVALKIFALKLLDLPQFREVPNIFTRLVFSYWQKVRDHAEERCDGALEQYTPSGLVIRSERISEKVFKRLSRGGNGTLVFESSNVPYEPSPQSRSGEEMVQYFENAVQRTASYLPDILAVEWRYEQLVGYQGEEIDFALQKLTSKGFCVDIQPPCMQFVSDGTTVSLVSRQSLSVRIPREAMVRRVASFDGDSSSEEEFTADTVMVDWESAKDKISLSIKYPMTADEALEQMARELGIIARCSRLERRYAFDVSRLDHQEQRELARRLRELGYHPSIDIPFVDPERENLIKQYLYIDL